MINRDKEFKDFLISTSKQFNTEEDYKNAINNARDIYKDQYRHPYSVITGYILKDASENRDFILNTLSENINSMIDIIEENIKDQTREKDNNLLEKLTKLRDHINLESTHLKYYANKISILDEYLNNISQITQDLTQTTQDLTRKIQKLQNNLKNQQTQYVTILGIFASIVLAFVANFTFSTSIFSNIDKSSIYRLVFVMAFIAWFTANILYFLFEFIKNINDKNPPDKSDSPIPNNSKFFSTSNLEKHKLMIFNIFILLILSLDVVLYFIKHWFGFI